jgi:pSer/pThr/pTyr-binding forkhead associated (FHA) protein
MAAHLVRTEQHLDQGLGPQLNTIDLGHLRSATAPLQHMSCGRHPTNDVVLDTPRIPLLCSRFHSQVLFNRVADGYEVQDQGSKNGTYVNGQLISGTPRCLLANGDVLSFGGPAFVLRAGVRLRNPFCFEFRLTEPVLETRSGAVTRSVSAKRKRTPPDKPPAATVVDARCEGDLNCSICLDLLLEPYSLQCKHSFCCDCLMAWFKQALRSRVHITCPLCRSTKVVASPYNRFDEPIRALSASLSAEERSGRALRSARFTMELHARRRLL